MSEAVQQNPFDVDDSALDDAELAKLRDQQAMHVRKKEAAFAEGREAWQEEQQRCLVEMKDEGNAKLKAGQPAAAIRLYSEAIEMDRTMGERDEKFSAILYANRAAARLKQAECGWDEEYEAAERDCRRACERDPQQVKYHVRCASALSGVGRFDDAFQCLKVPLRRARHRARQRCDPRCHHKGQGRAC